MARNARQWEEYYMAHEEYDLVFDDFEFDDLDEPGDGVIDLRHDDEPVICNEY